MLPAPFIFSLYKSGKYDLRGKSKGTGSDDPRIFFSITDFPLLPQAKIANIHLSYIDPIFDLVNFLFFTLIVLVIAPLTPSSYSSSTIEVIPVTCPPEIQSGERAKIEYVIENVSPRDINISSAGIMIDRGLGYNKSMTGFLDTTSPEYPYVLNSTTELDLDGEFVSREAGSHYLDLALDYTWSKTKNNQLQEIYEICRIEVVPIKSDSSADIHGSLGAVIAAVGAIAGGSVGSYFTYRYGKRIEDEKAKRENERNKDFNAGIKDMVISELETYSKFVSDILSPTGTVPVNTNDASISSDALYIMDDNIRRDFNSIVQSLPKQYEDLPVETKANVFAGSTLNKIQMAYHEFLNLKLEPFGNYNDCLSSAKATKTLDTLKEALKSI